MPILSFWKHWYRCQYLLMQYRADVQSKHKYLYSLSFGPFQGQGSKEAPSSIVQTTQCSRYGYLLSTVYGGVEDQGVGERGDSQSCVSVLVQVVRLARRQEICNASRTEVLTAGHHSSRLSYAVVYGLVSRPSTAPKQCIHGTYLPLAHIYVCPTYTYP